MPASYRVLTWAVPGPGVSFGMASLRGFLVQVVISALYAVILWLSLMAFLVISDGPWLWALFASPFIISGVIVGLLVLDRLVAGAHWLWRSRSTWRWWRTGTPGRG